LTRAVVSIRDVSHYYREGSDRHQILFGISAEIEPGEIVILTGPSGSGKTTLLTLIGALRSVQEGSLQVLDRELREGDESTLADIRQQIGYIFQSHNLLEALTARENVEVALQLKPGLTKEVLAAKSTAALQAVGLGARLNAHPSELSGGQRQRVAIARALVTDPELLLADEPTASLDKHSGREVMDLLQQLAKERGVAVILVTHDTRILDIADRILTLEDGRLSSLMNSVATNAQHMLAMVAREMRSGNLATRMSAMDREEFLSLVDTVTQETQGLLELVDVIQDDTFRTAQEQFVVAFTSKIGELLRADDARLYFVDHNGKSIWSLLRTEDNSYIEVSIPYAGGIIGHVAQSGQAVNTGDATSLEWYDPQIDSHFPGSQLCVPVIDSHGNVFAVIQLANKRHAIMFDDADEGQLREFTNTCALVLESWWRMGCTCRAGGVGRAAECCDN
jgi:putative ABC transport system ATP-binding protein